MNAERDINDINSRLFIGDLYTQSAIFSSKRIIGVNMFSDESMLPYTMRGYSPSVSGVASSNAIVEVRELGQTIYTKTVLKWDCSTSHIYLYLGIVENWR